MSKMSSNNTKDTDKWYELYNFQKEYRQNNKITAGCLLRKLDIDPFMAQYLYSCNITPSKRDDSEGKKLRDALEILFKNNKIYSDDSDFEENVLEFLKNNMNNLKIVEDGINDIIVKNKEEIIVVTSKPLAPEKAKEDLLKLDDKLFKDIAITTDHFFLATYLESPLCVKRSLECS